MSTSAKTTSHIIMPSSWICSLLRWPWQPDMIIHVGQTLCHLVNQSLEINEDRNFKLISSDCKIYALYFSFCS